VSEPGTSDARDGQGAAGAAWAAALAVLRRRADALRQDGDRWRPLKGEAGPAALAEVRAAARPLLVALGEAYRDLLPPGYPALDDNEIPGAGGSIGLRLSRWHAVFFALEHARKQKAPEPKPGGLIGALGVTRKRLPGEPLPPPDPNVELELAVLSLRWDDARGWVEVRRPLDPAWTAETLQEHLSAYVLGFNYDVAAGLLGSDPPGRGAAG
jgi:hypothetical protein